VRAPSTVEASAAARFSSALEVLAKTAVLALVVSVSVRSFCCSATSATVSLCFARVAALAPNNSCRREEADSCLISAPRPVAGDGVHVESRCWIAGEVAVAVRSSAVSISMATGEAAAMLRWALSLQSIQLLVLNASGTILG